MSDSWLAALFVCPLEPDGEAVLHELRERGYRTRDVPTGPAKRALSGTNRSEIVGVVITGGGLEAARSCALFWATRARRIAVVGAGLGTRLVPEGSIVVDGDAGLVDRAVDSAKATPVVRGRIATVTNPTETGEAQTSLAALGIAAADSEAGPWRDAGNPARRPILLVRALIHDEGELGRARRLLGPGAARPSWHSTLAHALRSPADARVWGRAVVLAQPLRAAAAAAAVAALSDR